MRAPFLSLFLLATGVAYAATPWRESFQSGLEGWTNTSAPAWRGTNGYAQVVFPALPAPQTATLLATGHLASAAFVGDYGSADLGLVGFRFQAVHVLPSGLTLRWMRGTNGYFRNLQHMVQATGVWYTLYCSLADKETGGWSGDASELFDHVLGAVDSVSLSILTPATVSPATFRVDDILVDRLHRATYLPGPHDPVIRWEYLQSNSAYRLEQADQPDGTWILDRVVPATNHTTSVVVTNLMERAAWRLVLP